MSNTPATPTPESAAAAAPKKKGSSKLFMIIGAVVVLLGGGGGAFWMMRKPAEAKEAEEPKKKETHAGTGILSFEPFVVNLADPGAQHFLRINVRLIVKDEEEAKHIEHSEAMVMRLRSDILELLTTQTSEHITAPEGKAELRKEIGERASHILDPIEVDDVLFSDFVVQY